MPTDIAHEKQQVHQLVDRLAPSQVTAVRGLLEAMLDPAELTDAERRAVSEADEWLKHNRPIPHEEVLAEFGLTMADWEKMADASLTEETPQGSG